MNILTEHKHIFHLGGMLNKYSTDTKYWDDDLFDHLLSKVTHVEYCNHGTLDFWDEYRICSVNVTEESHPEIHNMFPNNPPQTKSMEENWINDEIKSKEIFNYFKDSFK